MHQTYIPCLMCYELMTYDPIFEDYKCRNCGPDECIVPECILPVYGGGVVCPDHLCASPECNPCQNTDGDYVFFGGKIHITHLAKQYQEMLETSAQSKGITCTKEVRICICHEYPDSGYVKHRSCRVVYKPANGFPEMLCAPCWGLNTCKGKGNKCVELVDVTDHEKREKRLCKNGVGKCYTQNPCEICTAVFCNLMSASKMLSKFCHDCRAANNICYTCYRFEPKNCSMLFSKVVFGTSTSMDRCIYCVDKTSSKKEVRIRAYMLQWRFMKNAVRSCIARNVGLSERMNEANAWWYFLHRDLINKFELDDLIHNADANAIMERIIASKSNSKRSSAFALMYDVAHLPLVPFLRIMHYLDGAVNTIL